jgi:hypothetical protein
MKHYTVELLDDVLKMADSLDPSGETVFFHYSSSPRPPFIDDQGDIVVEFNQITLRSPPKEALKVGYCIWTENAPDCKLVYAVMSRKEAKSRTGMLRLIAQVETFRSLQKSL